MFKVGDSVRVVRCCVGGSAAVQLGAVATVLAAGTRYCNPDPEYRVTLGHIQDLGGKGYGWSNYNFELMPEPCEPARVATTLPTDSAARKDFPLWRGLLRYFPAALAGAAKVSKLGNDKHNPGQELHHARGKSMDHGDCVLRHLLDVDADCGKGVGFDEAGVPQVDYIVWRALAFAQEWHEAHGAPLAPAARLPK